MTSESDPDGMDASTPGAKLDEGKVQLNKYLLTYFPYALEKVARVSEYGADKYSAYGWRRVKNGYERYTEALLRHLLEEQFAPDDDDSGFDHAAQVAWNALARYELYLEDERKLDILLAKYDSASKE